MAQTLKFGNKVWAAKEDSVLAYNDINNNYKPLPFDFARASIGTRVNKDGLIETMGQDIARIDYTDSADGVLLLEPSSTNLATLSENFSGWSNISNATVTSNYTISPEGVINATRLQFTGNGYLFNLNSPAQVNGTQYTLSCYAKRNDSETQSFGFFSNGSTAVDNAMVLTNQWKRFYYTYTASNVLQLGLSGLSGADVSVYGFQVEQSSYSTSYIATSGSTVTRAAETCNNSGNSEVFNDSEGVLFADIAANANDNTYKLTSISDGSDSNRITLGYYNTDNKLYIEVRSGGVNQTSFSYSIANSLLYSKLALSYKLNDVTIWVNGIKGTSDTSASMPIGLSELNFNYTDSLPFYGSTKEIGYYNTALTDLELETLTSYKSWTSMVNELNLNIIYNG